MGNSLGPIVRAGTGQRASPSANVVSIRTCVLGNLVLISRVASMPLPSARRTSITTTSGRAHSARSMASLTAPASAATVMSLSSSSSALMPLRTTSWSSTIMMRSGSVMPTCYVGLRLAHSARPRLERQGDANRGSLAGGALQGESAADRGRPLLHVAQPLSGGASAAAVQAPAVVVDLEHGLAVALQEAEPAGAGLGVPGDVGEGLADDLHQRARGVGETRRDSGVDVDCSHDSGTLLELGGQFA